MSEPNIYLALSVIWSLNMTDVSLCGFTYVYVCVTGEEPLLTGF